MIKRKWKKCGVGGRKGETKLLLQGNVRKKVWERGTVQTHPIYHS